jgi:hypothetical protein
VESLGWSCIVAKFPEAAGLKPSQTRRAALREAAKSITQVRSTWLFAHGKTSWWRNIRQGGDCEKCVEYLFVLIRVIVDLCCNKQYRVK